MSTCPNCADLGVRLKLAIDAMEKAPERIRAGMEGHKGEAYRVATQVLGEILEKIRPRPS
jgi:hypothetical protein